MKNTLPNGIDEDKSPAVTTDLNTESETTLVNGLKKEHSSFSATCPAWKIQINSPTKGPSDSTYPTVGLSLVKPPRPVENSENSPKPLPPLIFRAKNKV